MGDGWPRRTALTAALGLAAAAPLAAASGAGGLNCLMGAGAAAAPGVRAGGADARRPSAAAAPLPLVCGAAPLPLAAPLVAPAAASSTPPAAASAGFPATTTSPRLGPIGAPLPAVVRFAPSAEVRAERLPARGRLSAALTGPGDAGPAGVVAAAPPKTGEGCEGSPLAADTERAAIGAAGCAARSAAPMELERLAGDGVMLLTRASNGLAVAPPPPAPPPPLPLLPPPPMPSASVAARPLRHASATSFSSIAL